MTNYYEILGVSQSSSTAEIKKAYRSLAMKHHPDRGGDQATFKEISVAYDTLSDSTKKAEYDHIQAGGQQFRFHTGGGYQDVNDMFGGSPFASHFQDLFGRQLRKNKDLNIQCQITLLDSFIGKQLEANFTLPSGRAQSVSINIPAGVEHGATIRYQGLGDDTAPQLSRGNLNVTIVILPDAAFRRQHDNLYTTIEISPFEAMLGCTKRVKQIAGQEISFQLPAGVNPGTEFASTGKGFPNAHNHTIGKFIIVVNIKMPAITDPLIISRMIQLNDDINASIQI